MQNKMLRFLTSLSLHDPERFDMDFEICGRDSVDHNKVVMTIRKETPWSISLLEEFQAAIGTIKYNYSLRFCYSRQPSFADVDDLFQNWYLSEYHGIPPFQLTPGKNGSLLVYLPDGVSFSTSNAIIGDFNAFLKWLCYPYVASISEEKPEEQPETKPETKEEIKPAEAPAPEMASEDEATDEKDDDKEDEDDDKCASATSSEEVTSEVPSDAVPEADDAEAERQASLQAAEAAYMAQLKVEEQQQQKPQFNTAIFRKGDYQEVSNIQDLFALDFGNVQFTGQAYSSNAKLGRRGGLFGTIGVADDNSAIDCRVVESKRGLSADDINGVHPGDMVMIRGALENDNRTGVRQVFVHYIDHLPARPLRTDPEPEKRVELHLHTKMSVMDGVGDIDNYVAVAKNMGMTALAVTDHGVIQSFPEAESAGKKAGIKILYGCEFYMFDFPKYVYNPTNTPLRKSKYCVLDFETTGLSNRYDHPTEFGAVMIENGILTKRFDQFINPGVHIPEAITAKTHITDDMVKDGPNEIVAAKLISDFIGDGVIVSHNAPFDVGFLNAIRKKAGMGPITNPVIDTLALSHYLFPEAARHTLGALSRNLNLDVYDEEGGAHRADYDAEALNNVWQVIIPILTKTNPDLTQADLEKLTCDNPNIFKHIKSYHMVALCKNQQGLKDLYRLISDSHTLYLSSGISGKNSKKDDDKAATATVISTIPKIPRFELEKYRANLIFGSACFNSEVFEIACNKNEQELKNAMAFYDYIEVQPLENYSWLVNMGDLTKDRLLEVVKSIISTADGVGKPVCATGDCHYVNPEDKICRDIYISAMGLGNTNHPLFPKRRSKLPNFPNPDQHFRSTKEMLDCFREFLPEEKCREIVIKNTNAIADQIEPLQILHEKLYPPAANLPNSDLKIRAVIDENIRKTYGDHPDPAITDRINKELKGIIENGYSVTYYIAHLIIKYANENGYIVGSRGSVGSSFAATMSGITEVNPLKPHYVCPKCHHFEWSTDPKIRSGFDLPHKNCPECGTLMVANGQGIPFETFLGFKAEKVPDIDLNFPPDFQGKAHAYARSLLSTPEENEKIAKGEPISNPHVIRAGTIATVEDKNAFGYIRGYYERTLHQDWGAVNKAWVAFLATRCTGVKRTTGQHPGGIVVIPADMDIFDFTPYQHPADDPDAEWLTTHYEFASMHDSVLKLDMLGHVDPQALRMMSLMTNVDVRTIPMDDKKVLSLFSSPKALGLKENPLNFQTGAIALPEFGTPFVQGLLEEAKPKTFDDLLIISGLSHGTNVWNNNAEDLIKNKVTDLRGVIGCRDDIMSDLIGYGIDDSKAFKIMEYVRKNKVGKPLKDEDVQEMQKHGVPDYFIESCRKIRYLFPRAHATAYVIGACRVAWFKLYHPLEFYATYFSVRCDKFDVQVMTWPLDKIVEEIQRLQAASHDTMTPFKDRFGVERKYSDKDDEILKTLIAAAELVDRGYHIRNIDINKSLADSWAVDAADNAIIPPFTVISGLGRDAGQSVVDARNQLDKDGKPIPFLSKEDLHNRTKLSESDIEELTRLGSLDGLGETNQMSLFDF
jgi:DNA polymerase III subunit alpha, Gram-positive type